jgi:Zn finger protein HypA/HybF involved in hydrogenase expression
MTNKFIQQAKSTHINRYNYTLVDYIDSQTKIPIICKIHGIFLQTPNNHLCGKGCPKCSGKNLSKEEKIKNCEIIHGKIYDYSKFDFSLPVCKKSIIICDKHGEFFQSLHKHINYKHGCPKCKGQNKNTDDVIKEFKNKHENRYEYSNVQYKGWNIPVKIYCKIHGTFNQTPNNHLAGNGCPTCMSSKGELVIEKWLKSKNIIYNRQYKFDDCKYKRKLPFDFYLPTNNILIEYNGEQHYKPTYIRKTFIDENELIQIKIRDKIKRKYCKNNNIELIIIPYTKFDTIEKILDSKIIL